MARGTEDANGAASKPGSIGGKDCRPPDACIDCLRASALGVELTHEESILLRGVVKVHRLAKGETLISEGEHDDRLYAIAFGKLEVSRPKGGGDEICLQRLEAGVITGELAFIDALERTASVRATSEACVISMRRDSLESLLPRNPTIVYKVMKAIVRSAHRTVQNLDTAYTDFVRYVST